ncbi:hypothetical protein BJ508DRAFT_309554 [Ascobolus immersus RN42]|uniref:Uncharacterized protein n=1 Tax=Ascobolus immersus RN42 TaxID=1160509 RepID=A0A3N4HW83_ASCIM|nr:hypothetical protein BJ508DRAFT_309554 [Ascobolus immersus RN42]
MRLLSTLARPLIFLMSFTLLAACEEVPAVDTDNGLYNPDRYPLSSSIQPELPDANGWNPRTYRKAMALLLDPIFGEDYRICFTPGQLIFKEREFLEHLNVLNIPYLLGEWMPQAGDECTWVRMMGKEWEGNEQLLRLPDVLSVTLSPRPPILV